MLTGIEIMLKRMETHPEEFVGINGGCSKEWYATINPVIPYLTGEERQALVEALAQAHRDYFNGQVLKRIAGETIADSDYLYHGESLVDRINGTSKDGILKGNVLGRSLSIVDGIQKMETEMHRTLALTSGQMDSYVEQTWNAAQKAAWSEK